jgi:twitching motility protein PilT
VDPTQTFESLVELAKRHGASDLHLEPGLPPTLRVDGSLRMLGEPLSPLAVATIARTILGDQHRAFVERFSADLSRTVHGVRLRINVLKSIRGVGLAVRLLAGFQPTLTRLNLLPDLGELVEASNGLVLVCGPTGSGKSSTLAALIQKLNETSALHIITIEDPVEYYFHPRASFVRQREVGKDTPSFERGLMDALREDPDVLLVGEMREPETMRLTMNAAETGHLVLSTLHSSSAAEALQRLVNSFPSERRPLVQAQLADCLHAVVAQRMRFLPELKIRVPECEVLRATNAVRSIIRQGQFFKLTSVLQSGMQDGQWTFERYRAWLDNRTEWFVPGRSASDQPDSEPAKAAEPVEAARPAPPPAAAPADQPVAAPPAAREHADDVIVIERPEGSLNDLLSQLDRKPKT